MLNQDEELWSKDLPPVVEGLLGIEHLPEVRYQNMRFDDNYLMFVSIYIYKTKQMLELGLCTGRSTEV